MFSLTMLPDLTPRDSHSLWYTSRHSPSSLPSQLINSHDPSSSSHDNANNDPTRPGQPSTNSYGQRRRAALERTALARLRFDEQLLDRRRLNVSNFGSAWLKPPGVPKTLFQMREEGREAEEHAEAMRREAQLAAQLAEAEAEAEGIGADEPMDEAEGMEEQDLDDEIPEAEGFGFDGEDENSEEDEEEVTQVDSEDEDSATGTGNAGVVLVSQAERRDMHAQVRDMRAAEDRVRDMMARGAEDSTLDMEGDASVIDNDDRAQMLEEDDLVVVEHHNAPGDMSVDMDMDADLDGDIPEADDGYEHTDSDAYISDDDGTRELSFAGGGPSGGRAPQASRFRRSLPRSSVRSSQRGSLAQSDVDISGLLSRDGNSYIGSSPHMRRRA